jgi:hypothetical protein
MTRASIFLYVVALALLCAGLFVPFWPIAVVGVLLLSCTGRWIAAIGAGIVLDVLWGSPTGMLSLLHIPYTLLGLCGFLLRYWGSIYFLDRHIQERV